jgi:aminoglycoside phosphotransferase (APT) family kinase protein
MAMIRARKALQAAGFDTTVHLERASSVTNEVWLTDDMVIRVNTQRDHRLQREMLLTGALPDCIGYPPVIDYGGDLGSDWLIVGRLPGMPLSRAWPTMTVDQRRLAISQLAERLKALHATEAPRVEGLTYQPQLLDRASTGDQAVARLREAIRVAGRLHNVDPGVMLDVDHLVAHSASVLEPFDGTTLVHGDLTFENMLWDGEQLTALLDFEWARPGPPDLDLDVLLRFVAYPFLHVAADYEHLTLAADYAPIPRWLQEDYPELFAHPRQFERVQLYSIAWDVQELLRFPPLTAVDQLHEHHPYNRLLRLLRGVSYLDAMNGNVAISS